MDFTRLDKHDELIGKMTKRAEQTIVSEVRWTSIAAYMIGTVISAVISSATRLNNVGLAIFGGTIMLSLLLFTGWLITEAMRNVRKEFRRLEGCISIQTFKLVEEIEKDANTKSK